MLAWERQRRLQDKYNYIQELDRVANFSWEDWRKRVRAIKIVVIFKLPLIFIQINHFFFSSFVSSVPKVHESQEVKANGSLQKDG